MLFSVWDLIIDKFDERQQYANTLLLNKKFNQFLKNKKVGFFYYLKFCKYTTKFESLDWERIYQNRDNVNKCNLCTKELEEDATINIYSLKFEKNTSFNYFLHFPEYMVCDACKFDPTDRYEVSSCAYKSIQDTTEQKKDNKKIRFFLTTLTGKKFIFSATQSVKKFQIYDKISIIHHTYNFVFMGKYLDRENDFLVDSINKLDQEHYLGNLEYFNHFNFFFLMINRGG